MSSDGRRRFKLEGTIIVSAMDIDEAMDRIAAHLVARGETPYTLEGTDFKIRVEEWALVSSTVLDGDSVRRSTSH